MLNLNKKFIAAVFLASLTFTTTGCNEILDEQPRGIYTPDDFTTERGISQGVTSLYRQTRLLYGNGYFLNANMTGTDEATWAQSADGNFKDLDMTGGTGSINSNTFPTSMIWGSVFPSINTANGIIQNGSGAGIAESLISEARFFRSFYYFLLVQTYGGVPLDLGSGELAFNITPKTTSTRNTVTEVYTKAIIPDLIKAVDNLPVNPRVTGGVTKNVARLMLSKAYLTYAWWLQNPNSIPTYPETPRTDPAGHNAQYYFQKAYDVALEGINAPGPYGLMPTYYDIHRGDNDRNKECMLYADHTETSAYFNEGVIQASYGDGWSPNNFAAWMFTFNYTNLKSSLSSTAFTNASSVQRAATQSLGRPWVRMAPTVELLKNTFADKTNDSRYDGTFVTSYRGNWNKEGTGLTNVSTLYNANNLPIQPGDAVLSFLNDDSQLPVYPSGAGQSGIGAGVLPGRADWVVAPSGVSRIVYPGVWKIGTYRTDNGNGLGYPNPSLTRPFTIAKFSEFYFLAAEAAIKGASGSQSARDLINVLRARAGKWVYSVSANAPKVQDNSAAMIAATPATITLDYLLAERSREYYGEGYRWYDLVRTQTWAAKSASYSIGGVNYGNHTPQTVTRTIQPFHYLRPIPQGQLDAMEVSADIKAKYQNPGY